MGRFEQLKYRLLSAKAWFAEKRATRRYGWWSGFWYAYMMSGSLQAAVFSKTVSGLALGSFMKFALIWPLWSYATVVQDYRLGASVIEFVFDVEIQEEKLPPSKKRAEDRPV